MRDLCLSLAGVVLLGGHAPPPWHANVADAFTEARRAHKPILAVLHCPH